MSKPKTKFSIAGKEGETSIVPGELLFYSEYPNHCFFVYFRNREKRWVMSELETGGAFAYGKKKRIAINEGIRGLLKNAYLESDLQEIIDYWIERRGCVLPVNIYKEGRGNEQEEVRG